MEMKIGVIKGDGIGPEIVDEAMKVLDRIAEVYGHSISYTQLLMGGASIDVNGVPLTDETLEAGEGMRRVAHGIHRRGCEDVPLVSAGAVKTSGSRAPGPQEGAEPVCKPPSGHALSGAQRRLPAERGDRGPGVRHDDHAGTDRRALFRKAEHAD